MLRTSRPERRSAAPPLRRAARCSAAIDAQLAEDRARAEAAVVEAEAVRRAAAIRARQQLERQMDARLEAQQLAQEVALQERVELDEMAARIMQEDARTREERCARFLCCSPGISPSIIIITSPVHSFMQAHAPSNNFTKCTRSYKRTHGPGV